MTTTYTPIARAAQMTALDPAVRGLWGPIANAAWLVIEQLAAGNTPININGLGNYSLTVANNAPDQAGLAIWNFIGALSSSCNVTVPSVARIGWAKNSTTGGMNIFVTTGSGRILTLYPGETVFWTSDGTNIDRPTKLIIDTIEAATGTFTTLSADTAISGAIGATTPNTGKFTTLTATAAFETSVAMGANNVGLNTGNLFLKTVTANTTFTVSNVPASGVLASFVMEITNGGAYTVTWWAGVKWPSGTVPALTISGTDILGFYTRDGGTTWRGLLLGKDMV